MRAGKIIIFVLAGIVIVAGLYVVFFADRAVVVDVQNAAKVVTEPVQTQIENGRPWRKGTYLITPLAEYDITAKVLSIEYYRYGRETNLSPVDFALGWGPMSDENISKHFTISQHERWSSWRSPDSPIPIKQVLLHCANVHIVPPNKAMMKQIGKVSLGDIIRIKGKLIQAQGSDGWTWTSSLSRSDEGEQSCEIIWVESLEIR